jgi:glucokinase
MTYAIGFDIGGTNIKYVAVKSDGTLLLSDAMMTSSAQEPFVYWRDRLINITNSITSKHGKPKGVGVAAPGLAAENGRSIAWMKGRMEAVQDVDWTLALGLGRKVPVMNDAQAALLGEAWCGAAAGFHNAALLTLGTGVGGACMVDGRILRGFIGRAGHLGHICLDPHGQMDIVNTPGSLEDAIGECTLAKRSAGRFKSTSELLQAHQAADEQASEIWQRSILCLACGMVSIINVVDPAIFIIGGGIAHAGDALFKPLNELMDKYEWRPTGTKVSIVPAALGEYAGAIGAARAAMS